MDRSMLLTDAMHLQRHIYFDDWMVSRKKLEIDRIVDHRTPETDRGIYSCLSVLFPMHYARGGRGFLWLEISFLESKITQSAHTPRSLWYFRLIASRMNSDFLWQMRQKIIAEIRIDFATKTTEFSVFNPKTWHSVCSSVLERESASTINLTPPGIYPLHNNNTQRFDDVRLDPWSKREGKWLHYSFD